MSIVSATLFLSSSREPFLFSLLFFLPVSIFANIISTILDFVVV